MKKPVLILAGMLLPALVLVLVALALKDIQPLGQKGPWKLVFHDEFEGTAVDPEKWTQCYWWDDEGCTNAGNNEMEWYLPDNVLLNNGILVLRAMEKRVRATDGETYRYTSGMITTGMENDDDSTQAKFSFEYGYVEMRAKVPSGQGIWPAFWLLPDDFTSKPEIDVLEILGHEPGRIIMSLHYLDEDGEYQRDQEEWRSDDFSLDFHVYAVDWQPDVIVWYVDGVERARTTAITQTESKPLYLLANLAVGGDWPGSPDETTAFPADFEIDYIRVWQKETR